MCQIVSLLAVNACQYILWDMKIRGIDLLEQINLRFIFYFIRVLFYTYLEIDHLFNDIILTPTRSILVYPFLFGYWVLKNCIYVDVKRYLRRT